MLMGSKLHGVPVSATEAAPPASPKALSFSSNSATLSGIRAPLTLDDSDFEYDSQDGAFSSYESDSAPESDGFLSGEDGPETAAPDDGSKIVKETHFVKEYVVPKASVKNPLVEIDKEISFKRSFEDSRPFSAGAGEEEAVGTSSEEDENENPLLVRLPVLNNKRSASLNRQQLGIPIAKVTMDTDDDDDDDFESNRSVEDEPFLGIARVPSIGDAVKLSSSAPRVKTLEVGGAESSAPLNDSGLEGESVGGGNGLSNSDFEEKQIADDLTTAEFVEDKGHVVASEKARSVESCDEIPELNVRKDSVEYNNDENTSESTGCVDGKIQILSSSGSNSMKDIVCDALDVEITELKEESSMEEANHALYVEVTEVKEENSLEEANQKLETKDVGMSDLQVVEEPGCLMNGHSLDVTFGERCGDVEELSLDHGKCGDENINLSGTVSEPCLRDDVDDLSSEIVQKADDASKYVESEDITGRESQMQLMNKVNLSDLQVLQEPGYLMNGHVVDMTCGESYQGVEEASTNYRISKDDNINDIETVIWPCVFDDENDLDNGNEDLIDKKLVIPNAHAPEHLEPMDSSKCDIQFMNNNNISDSQAVQLPLYFINGHSADVTSGESAETDSQATDAELIVDSGILLDAHCYSEGEDVHSSLLLEEPSITVEPVGSLGQGEKLKLEKFEKMVVKFLQLVHRLHKSPKDSAVAKVLQQLLLAAGMPPQAKSFDIAKETGLALEAEENKNGIKFSLNVLIIGKSGVGKSATINSIFGGNKSRSNAFEPGTNSVKVIKGTLDGIHIQVLDTPGLSSSIMDHSFNCKVLSSIKKYTKKLPPDVVLYVDRLDAQIGDLNDLPLLKLISSSLGSSIWSKTILILTHAASVPPEGPSSDHLLSYDSFVAKISRSFQQLVSNSVGYSGITEEPNVIPVSLTENCCMRNGIENNNGESWRSQILLLCFSMKILSETDSLLQKKHPDEQVKRFQDAKQRRKWIAEDDGFMEDSMMKNDAPEANEGGSTGLIQHGNDAGNGAMLGIRLREEDYFSVQGQMLLGLSLTRSRKDLPCGLNLHSQFSVPRNSKLCVQARVKGEHRGAVSVKLNSSDQTLIATMAFVPIASTICKTVFRPLCQRKREH